MDVITYPCPNLNLFVFIKEVPGVGSRAVFITQVYELHNTIHPK